MSRLPTPGADNDQWGTLLNDFLSQSIDAVGSLKPTALTAAGSEMVANKNQPNGYAGLDGSGLIAANQVPGVGGYLGLYTESMNISSGASSGQTVSFDGITAQLGSNSISWDSGTPDTVTILQTGVYSITVGVYWRDLGASGPISLQILSSCEFNICDIRPAIGDGATESQQFLTAALYLQTGQSFEVNISHTTGSTLTPLVTVLVTRCA